MINSERKFTLEDILSRFNSVLQEKILHSVELLRKAERLALSYDPEDGYFNTFSGGKDSQCLYHIVKLAGVKAKTHMNLTSVDPPEVIRFVRTQYPDVELIKPQDSIFNIAIKKKILPSRQVRWCCEEYKELSGAGKVTLIGIRHAESPRRAKRNEVEVSNRKYSGDLDGLETYRKGLATKPHRGRKVKQLSIVNADGERVLGCIHGKESLLISPIIDWTDDDVWTFLDTLGIAHCELYDQGWKRIGCINCPMSQPRLKALENERWPHVKRNWIKAIKVIRGGKNKGMWALQSPFGDKASLLPDRLTEEQENEIAEGVYDWWISGKAYKQWYAEKFIQQNLFKTETNGNKTEKRRREPVPPLSQKDRRMADG